MKNETCFYCQAQGLIPFFKGVKDHRGLAEQRHDFYRCSSCGSIRLVPLPSEPEVIKSYPQEYCFKKESSSGLRGIWNSVEWAVFYLWVFRISVKLIAGETEIYSGRVLDLGCGSGLRLQQFNNAGYETEGVDMAPGDVRYATEVLGLKVWQADLVETPLPQNRYDLIMAYWVLEHLSEPVRLIQKIRDSLTPSGWAIIAVPLADSWICRLFRGSWCQIKEAPRHLSIPTVKGMIQSLEKNGLKYIRIKPVSTYELAGDIALTLWPRGLYATTMRKGASCRILDRVWVGTLTLMAMPIVTILKIFRVKQGLTVFFAQKAG